MAQQPVRRAARRRLTPERFQAAALLVTSLALMTHLYLGFAIIAPPSSDGIYYYHFLASWLGDGDLDFANNYHQPVLPAERTDPYQYGDRTTATGLPYNAFTIGPSILWLPFAGPGVLASYLLEPPSTGWPRLYRHTTLMVIGWSSVLYAHLTALLLAGIYRRYLSYPLALWLALSNIWLTNGLHYAIQQPFFSHIPDLFALSLLTWLLWRWSCPAGRRQHDGWLVAAGLAAGLAVDIRPQNAVSVLILALACGLVWARLSHPHWERIARAAGLFALPAVFASLPLLIANRILFGHMLAIPQGAGFLDLAHPHLWQGLFANRNGLMTYSPFLLLGALGGAVLWLVRGRKPAPRLVVLVWLPYLAIFAVQLWINTANADWWGGAALGQRRLISSYPLFSTGLVLGWLALRQKERLKRTAGRAAAIFSAACLVLNVEYTSLVPLWGPALEHDRPIVRDLAYHAAGQITREAIMRPRCTRFDIALAEVPISVFWGDAHSPESLVTDRRDSIHTTIATPTFILGRDFPVSAPPGSRVHFGFRLSTPYGWRSSVTLVLWDLERGEPFAEQIYYNIVGGTVGVTGWVPRSPMTLRAQAFFNNTRLPDPMPIAVRDVELCLVRP